jgi:hypothetical protein
MPSAISIWSPPSKMLFCFKDFVSPLLPCRWQRWLSCGLPFPRTKGFDFGLSSASAAIIPAKSPARSVAISPSKSPAKRPANCQGQLLRTLIFHFGLLQIHQPPRCVSGPKTCSIKTGAGLKDIKGLKSSLLFCFVTC